MSRIIQTGIRPEPLCTNILNCFTMISDYTRLWVISHPWNMRKTKESLNSTVHQSQYTVAGAFTFAMASMKATTVVARAGSAVNPWSSRPSGSCFIGIL